MEETRGREILKSQMKRHKEEANGVGKWERSTKEEGGSCITSRKSFMGYFTKVSRK